MKELSIEEKAKAYDETIEKLRNFYRDYDTVSHIIDVKEELANLIPELKENEDERIRKTLIHIVKGACNKYGIKYQGTEIGEEKLLAWLEKQGEQKGVSIQINPSEYINDMGGNGCYLKNTILNPIDKVEPKFHEGDWIISNNAGNPPLYITNINDKHYIFSERDSIIKIEDCDDSYHLWSLKDAKDGDVLRIRNLTFIFQEITNNNVSHKNATIAYCSYEDDDDSFGVSGPDCITDLGLITPATKEQRDILFTKMKEAGYEWDAENKELKRIYEEVNGEDYGIDGLYHAQRILEKTLGKVDGYQTDDGILDHKAAITIIRKLYEQKFVWDEDDARNLNSILSCIKHCQDEDIEAQYNGNRNVDPKRYDSLKHWIKFLKNRIQSQNFIITDTELIKAKKDAYNDALNKIEYHSDTPTFDDGWSAAIDYIRKKYVK